MQSQDAAHELQWECDYIYQDNNSLFENAALNL